MASLKCVNDSSTFNWVRCLFCHGGRFIDNGVKSEFQAFNHVTSGNLTDFSTRCSWASLSPVVACPPLKEKNDWIRKQHSSLWRPFDEIFETTFQASLRLSISNLRLPNFNYVGKSTGPDKPYRCDYAGCGKSFARNEELTRHKRIHSGERPHQCEICFLRFGRKDHLTKHRKTHIKASERRNYVCDIGTCDKSFTRSDALTRHQSKIHKIKKSHTRLVN